MGGLELLGLLLAGLVPVHPHRGKQVAVEPAEVAVDGVPVHDRLDAIDGGGLALLEEFRRLEAAQADQGAEAVVADRR